MTETGSDPATGLPLLGAKSGNRQVPIDPALLPELREKIALADSIEVKAGDYALNVLKALAVGATIGAEYANAERDADQFINKVLALHNVTREQCDPVAPLDLEKGMINVRP